MSVKFFSEDAPIPKLKKRILIRWIKNVIVSEGKSVGDISFIFCSDSYLLEVNNKYLDHDYYTDIITFGYVKDNLIQGDIFVSVDRVKENAGTYNTSFENEIQRILIHGVLHLLGYKDKSKKDKYIMTSKEDIYLKMLTVS
ncbi:MAG: rRNA maturation RNase YbeY [Bacteroidota bacterium]|nr:rRNA maturation RNase YbeY [Odoribacter sp.]MDP3641951.1 rRNA maturation RNase YbeY [Bacteroidota bacterium]